MTYIPLNVTGQLVCEQGKSVFLIETGVLVQRRQPEERAYTLLKA